MKFRVDMDLVNAVSLEEVVEELCPLAAAHHHPQVHRPVLLLDAVGCRDKPPMTYQAGTAEGGSPDQPSQVC